MIQEPKRHSVRILPWLAVAMLLVPGPAWSLAGGPVGGSSSRLARSSQQAQVSAASVEQARVRDVRLGSDGTLSGRVRDEQGHLLVGAKVVLSRGRQVIAVAVTDDRGEYRIGGLAGGVYRVRVAADETIVRLWSSESAPPQAQEQLVLDAGLHESIEARGQGGEGLDPAHRFGLDGEGGLDSLEMTMLTTSVISLTLSAVMLSKIDELQDAVDRLPASD